MELTAPTAHDLAKVARSFVAQLNGRKIWTFDAAMGAGKTTFIQHILKEMGVPEPDGSPTYSIVNTYFSQTHGDIAHLDVYRLEGAQEAMDAGIDELLDSGAYCFVEWSEHIAELLPEEAAPVSITVLDSGERVIKW